MKNNIRKILAATTIFIMVITGFPMADPADVCAQSYSAPGRVKSLTLSANSSPSSVISWEQVSGGADSYKVYRDNKAIAEVKPDPYKEEVSYVDKTLAPGRSYTYTVKACRIRDSHYTYGPASPSAKIEKGYSYKSKNGNITLTGYTGDDKSLEVPASLAGGKVTGIGEGCFANNVHLETVRIPEGIREIDDYGFECCSLIKKVYLPKSLRSIGEGAFSGCAQMSYVDMEDGLTSIGRGAFLYCMKLRMLEIPESVSRLGRFAFAGCEALTSVEFNGDQVSDLPDRIFCNCINLSDVMLSDSIDHIGKRAFFQCLNLRQFDDEENESHTITIESYAFQDSALQGTEEYFDRNTVYRGKYAFSEEAEDADETDSSGNDNEANPDGNDNEAGSGGDDNEAGSGGDDNEADPGGDDNYVTPEFNYQYKWEQGNKSIFEPAKFSSYLNIADEFDEWCKKYIAFNSNVFYKGSNSIPYTILYKGEEHYRQMTSVLNHDTYKTKLSIERSGDDYAEMYLMMDHGLFRELSRGKMPDDLVLYSGITPERKAAVAGFVSDLDLAAEGVSQAQLEDRINKEYIDAAIMSTSAGLSTAFSFSGGQYGSQTIFVIYASKDAMDELGVTGVDAFPNIFDTEKEILFNTNARYRILEIGTVTQNTTATDGSVNDTAERTYIRMELLGKGSDESRALDGSEDLYEPVYKWAEDYSSVTASLPVSEDGSQTETEVSRDISYKILKKATETETGIIKYTAHFSKEYFSDQEIQVTLPVLTKKTEVENKTNIGITVSNIKNKTYTGKAIRPQVTVKIGNKLLKKGTDYTLSYKNNIKVGTAAVIISGTGSYTGRIKKTFKIVPAGTQILKTKSYNNSVRVRWKKAAGQISGYQIQYGLKKNFAGAKIKTSGQKTGVLKLIGLKAKKRYYIRIRTVKKIRGKNYYSYWSKTKNLILR